MAQVRPVETKAKAASQVSTSEKAVPSPEVVNSEVLPKQPADPLEGPPFITSRVWAVADGRTGSVLWGHRETEPVEIASTTKIMTALVVVRLMAKDPAIRDEVVTFSGRADRTVGSTSDVREGEHLPVHELLYGLLLPSGNDAAVALAEHFGPRLKPDHDATGQVDPLPRFIAEMNRVAVDPGTERDPLRQSQRPARSGAPLECARPGQAGESRDEPAGDSPRWSRPVSVAAR